MINKKDKRKKEMNLKDKERLGKDTKKSLDKLDKELLDTFPASDPVNKY